MGKTRRGGRKAQTQAPPGAEPDCAAQTQELVEALRREELRSRQLRGLAEASMTVNSARSKEDVLQYVTDQARTLIGAHQAVTSFTINHNWAQAITGLSLSDKYARFRSYDVQANGSGIYAMVCETNRPARMTQQELQAHSRWRGFGDEEARHPPMRGWLAAPLIAQDGENLGLIQLSDKFEGEFTEEDEAVLVQLAQLTSVALEARQAHEELEERVQERTAALERSNAELEQFAYVASHDLQEPLRKIQAFGALLIAEYRDALGAEGQDYLERMRRAAERMQTLINDLLALSRVARKREPFQQVDLGQVVAAVLGDLEAHIAQSGAQVEVGKLPALQADPTQMRQLFQNLISNALKYRRPDQAPRVVITSRPLNGRRGQAGCQIEVRDNGIGFDPKFAEQIFQPFQRLHGRDEYDGTGMGLAICRKIVQRHHGAISAEGKPGEGAAFLITLPMKGGVKGASNERSA